MTPKLASLALWLAAAASTLPAHAADPITSAMQAAYAPYRAALFRTNSKAQAESEAAMAQAMRAWAAIARQHAAAPAVPYAGDPLFAASLAEVNQVLAKADEQVRAGKLPEAHETLERVRDVLSAVRLRNGVVVFSDHMNDYHEVMEQVLIEGPKLLAGPQGPMRLMGLSGALAHLATRLDTQAPAELRAQPEFAAGQKAVAQSVAALQAALLAQDNAAVQAALAGLKKPYSQLFLKFG